EEFDLCSVGINFVIKSFVWDRSDNDSVSESISSGNMLSRGYNFYFTFSNLDKDGRYIEVLVNNEKHFLDLSICKQSKNSCEVIDIKHSEYEKDWIGLKEHQNNKDIDVLNHLISELKPCIEK